jgi:hypothetical protein
VPGWVAIGIGIGIGGPFPIALALPIAAPRIAGSVPIIKDLLASRES